MLPGTPDEPKKFSGPSCLAWVLVYVLIVIIFVILVVKIVS